MPSAPGWLQALDDPPEVIPYAVALTDPQQTHADAVARYTHGRVLLQRASQATGAAQQALAAEALGCMQRAWQRDAELVSIVEDIFPLALALNRSGVAARYAILAAERQEVPPELLERVAAALAEQEPDRALQLVRRLAARPERAHDVETQFELGRLALLGGHFDEAARALAVVRDALLGEGDVPLTAEYRARLLREPDMTYALLGESFLRAHRLDEAEAMYRRADEAKPNVGLLGYRLALLAQQRGQTALAQQQLDAYFESKITSARMRPYQLLAELLDGPRASDPPPAAGEAATRPPSPQLLDRLRALAAQDTQNQYLQYFLADRLLAAERWDEAETLFRRLCKEEATADAYQGLVTILVRQRRPEPLLQQLADVVGQTGTLESLQTTIAPLWEDRPLLTQLTALASEDTDREPELATRMRMALALLWAHAGEGGQAEALFRLAVAHPLRATGSFAVHLGFQLLQERSGAHAAAVLETVVRQKWLPDRAADLQYALAGAWAMAKDYERALAAARTAAQLEPHSPRMLAREPWVLYQARRFDDALAGYLALLARFDGEYDSDVQRDALREMRFVVSAIYAERQQFAEAEEQLEQILDEFPEDPGAMNDLGYLWSDQGQHLERALRMLQQAVQAAPNNVAYRDSLGWALYRLRRFPEALAELQIAAASEPADGVILDHLGDVYLELHELPLAREAWQRAVDAFTREDDAARRDQVHEKLARHPAS